MNALSLVTLYSFTRKKFFHLVSDKFSKIPIMSTKRKRVNLSTGQKCKICEMKERDLRIQNVELTQKYNIGKSTITDILKESKCWLTITESQENVKKFRGPKWP
ncbi:hypothetical protein RhiirA5_429413 [Rhizophagus irregularis]|uniref:Uncharacterized protein n=1 Tax=Rhizophagus irregularis TaxID=588596 RepID=A0A2I1EX00_9GLOM|nr:hypothetical protein RhiirA5_429413 [Rhizophagus irregularis]PKC56828.1 hypothetical protein RhiirA1_473434 [Rhizophagus irregularis]PKY26634.1 hypothetical protein RhiirB3_442014 [Rhizophagus irregularis]